MIDPDRRKVIYQLHQTGMSLCEISQRFQVSRNTVRAIIRQQGVLPQTVRKDKIQSDPDLLQRLYQECDGWIQRMHEKLAEEEGIRVSYPTLTRLLRELDLGRPQPSRCDQVPDERLLKHVLEAEYRTRSEKARLLRRKRAHIPEILEIETFPFHRQPKLDRKRVMSLYDRFEYMTKQRNIIWMGPTGCGKTGLASGFLLQAIDRGYRGYFILFEELLSKLYASLADHSEAKLLRKYAAYDCLLSDEVGYLEVEPAQVALFFTLMQRRHKSQTTLISSNLGYSEWGSFLKNRHLTSALLDRLSETTHVFNLKDCHSLRPKLNKDGARDSE